MPAQHTFMVATAEASEGALPEPGSFLTGPSFDDIESFTVLPYAFTVTAESLWAAVEGLRDELALQPGDVVVADDAVAFQVLPNTVADLDSKETLKAMALTLGRIQP